MQVKELTLNTSIIEDGKTVSKNEEIIEVFSKAFYEISKNFFKRRIKLREDINLFKNKQKKYILACMCLLILSIILSIYVTTVFIILIVISIILAIYFYKKYQSLIEAKFVELEKLRPEGEITFLSKVYIPFYIIPYNGGSILFDAINAGNKFVIELKNLDISKLTNVINRLESEVKNFRNMFTELADHETIKNYDVAAFEDKNMELKILYTLNSIKDILENVSVTHYEFYSHLPQSNIANALKNLINWNILNHESSQTIVPQRLSLEDAKKIVDDLKGIEFEAVKGDLVEIIQNHMTKVNDVIAPLLKVLRNNVDILKNYYEYLQIFNNTLLESYLCEQCYTIRKEDYRLTDIIRNGLSYTLDSLKELGEKEAVKEIEKDIESLNEIGLEIPEEVLKSAQTREDIVLLNKSGKIEFVCRNHGKISEIARGINGSDVLARVAMNVFDELKRPILQRASEMFRELDDAGASMRKERLAIAPFEQLFNQLNLENNKVLSEIKSLEDVINKVSSIE